MSEIRRPIELGVSVNPAADGLEQARAIVRAAEAGGLDFVGIQDHPYQSRFLDTWALIATLLAETRHLRFFPNVASLPLRPPAMMAKAAASLDRLSDGRFELGLGAGASADRAATMGGPRRSPGESVKLLNNLLFAGNLGLATAVRRIAAALGIDDGALLAVLRRGSARSFALDIAPFVVPLDGPVEHWIDTLGGWASELAVDTFIVWPQGDDPAAQVELFAADVAPRLRALSPPR